MVKPFSLTGVLLVLGCRAPPLPEPSSPPWSFSSSAQGMEVRLGPGDVLRVGVYGHPDLSTPTYDAPHGTRIDPAGFLSLPLVGPIAVGDLTVAEARAAIMEALMRYVQDPRVDVSVVEHAARRVYVYGEVAKPGAQVLDRPLNVYQALAIAGSFTRTADRSRVVLLRGTPEDLEVLVIDGQAVDEKGFVLLRPDDLVFVRRSGAGRFSDEVLPILTGISSSLASAATLILIEERVDQ